MSPELIGIIGVGLMMAGLVFTLNARLERRMDRMEERMNRLEEQNTQRFDAMDARLRGLEQSQAHLAGEMSTLREAILLRAAIQS